ncbi:MAG: hypothetical protein U0U67_14080 [Chitinophagales bacterium]
MKQVFFRSLLLAAFLPVFFISSCKKEDDEKTSPNISKRAPENDPDVEAQTLNLTINTNRSTYLDTIINAFGHDFHISIYQYSPYKYIDISTDYNSDVYFQEEIVLRVGQRSDDFLPCFLEGYKVDTYQGAWEEIDGYGDNTYGALYIKNTEGGFGFNGLGDRFIAYRNEVSSGNYKYGYIKLNLSADGQSLTIKSIAFCNVANKAIYFGDY